MKNSLNITKLKIAINKSFCYYKPNPKQLSFHTAGNKAIERLFLAGNRTGKTYCGCIEDAIHLTGVYPDWWDGHKFDHSIITWVASENYEITRNVLQKMLIGGYSELGQFTDGLIHPSLILKKAMLSGVNGAVDYVQIQHISGGVSSLYFKSYKQGREKFQGARCNLIHLDEEPPKDIYTECSMRLADVDGKGQGRMILTMTPLKGYTEMMSYFLEQRAEKRKKEDVTSVQDILQEDESIRTDPEIIINGKYYFQASWDDNLHLSEETKQQLRSTLKPYELEAREKGIPSIGSGLVYQVMESEFLVDPFDIPHYWPCVFGMDVGFFAPTAVVFMAHDKDNDILYIYKEYSVTEKTAAQHASSLMIMGCDWIRGVCDPSVNQGSQRDGERLIDDYAKAGLKLEKGKYAKELAVDTVLERIRTGKFKVFNNCRKFMDEWRGYSRDEDGKILKGRDHLMNALEFVILDGLPLARTKKQFEMRYNYYDKPTFF